MLRQSTRLFSTARLQRKTITDTAKDALTTVNEVASNAALKGVEATESVTNAAKATVAGSTKYAEGVADQVKGEASKASGNYTEGLGGQIKGEAKKVQGQAESKAEELKQKL